MSDTDVCVYANTADLTVLVLIDAVLGGLGLSLDVGRVLRRVGAIAQRHRDRCHGRRP